MLCSAFLASQHLRGIVDVLPAAPEDLRTVFVPTAGTAYEDAPWVDDHRSWFRANGFRFAELELAGAAPGDVQIALERADLVYVAGGNTYFLLHHMQRTEFWAALAASGAVYSGSSAGAIVACPDIAYIEDLDDRTSVPELASTRGGGLVDLRIMPHVDHDRFGPEVARIMGSWGDGPTGVPLRDDQAVVVDQGSWRMVPSPPGDLPHL